MVAGLAGCSREDSGPSKAEQDRLRSLPYLSEVEDSTGETGVVLHEEGLVDPGYTLYTVQLPGSAHLIDIEGRQVQTWADPEGGRWERSVLLADGSLLVIGFGKPTPGRVPDDQRFLAKFDWDGKLLWKRMLLTHHDVRERDDGNLLLLTFLPRRIPEVDPEIDLRDDQVTLLDPEGRVLEHLSMFDAFQTASSSRAGRLSPPASGSLQTGQNPSRKVAQARPRGWLARCLPFQLGLADA